jgi:hypothetical protein
VLAFRHRQLAKKNCWLGYHKLVHVVLYIILMISQNFGMKIYYYLLF